MIIWWKAEGMNPRPRHYERSICLKVSTNSITARAPGVMAPRARRAGPIPQNSRRLSAIRPAHRPFAASDAAFTRYRRTPCLGRLFRLIDGRRPAIIQRDRSKYRHEANQNQQTRFLKTLRALEPELRRSRREPYFGVGLSSAWRR